jgi:hypothetical protein
MQLLKELDAPVEYIVLLTFARTSTRSSSGPSPRSSSRRRYGWHQPPRQRSWPINVPLKFFRIFLFKPLKDEDKDTPWAAETRRRYFRCTFFQHRLIGCIGIYIHTVPLNIAVLLRMGPYVEVAFYHISLLNYKLIIIFFY